MPLTAASMAAKILGAQDAVAAVQTSDPAAALAHRLALLEALCEGIIGEIQQNAVVSTTGGHTGTVS